MIDEGIKKGLANYLLVPNPDVNLVAADFNWPHFINNCQTFIDEGLIDLGEMADAISAISGDLAIPNSKPTMIGTSTTCPTFTMIACYDVGWSTNQKALAKSIIRSSFKVEQLLEAKGKKYGSRLAAASKAYKRILVEKSQRLKTLPDGFGEDPWDLLRLSNDHITSESTLKDLLRLGEAAELETGGYKRVSKGRARSVRVTLETGPQGLLFESMDYRLTETGQLRSMPACAPPEDRSEKRKIISKERAYQRVATEASRNAKGRINSIKRSAQVLPIGHGAASSVDVARLLRWLCDAELELDEVKLAARLALLLMFLAGRPLDQILKFRVVESGDELEGQLPNVGGVRADGMRIYVPAFRPRAAKKVDDSWQKFVRPTCSHIVLPAPHLLRDVLNAYLTKYPRKNGSKLIRHTGATIEVAVKELLANEILPVKHTLTLHRFEAYLPLQLSNALGGRNIASFVLGIQIGGLVESQLYYISQRRQWVAERYQQAVAGLLDNLGLRSTFDKISSNELSGWVGSQVRSEIKVYRALGADIRLKLNELYSQRHQDYYYRLSHDYLTLYVLIGIQLLTGFRPFSSPISSFDDIDLITGFALVGDKAVDASHERRLVWLPPDFLEFLELYKKRRSASLVHSPAQKGVAPFFFYRSNMEPRDAKQGAIQELVEEFWDTPINAPRHFLVNYLIEQCVPSHVIDALMGHWTIGEEPYSAPSTLSPAQIRTELEGPITQLWHDLQWRIPKAMLR